jgi:hypothetical protein
MVLNPERDGLRKYWSFTNPNDPRRRVVGDLLQKPPRREVSPKADGWKTLASFNNTKRDSAQTVAGQSISAYTHRFAQYYVDHACSQYGDYPGALSTLIRDMTSDGQTDDFEFLGAPRFMPPPERASDVGPTSDLRSVARYKLELVNELSKRATCSSREMTTLQRARLSRNIAIWKERSN